MQSVCCMQQEWRVGISGPKTVHMHRWRRVVEKHIDYIGAWGGCSRGGKVWTLQPNVAVARHGCRGTGSR